MPPATLSKARLVAQLRRLGVNRGEILLVHASFRAVRPVQGGPTGVVDALLDAIGPEGTLVMPSWSDRDDEPFDPRTSPAAADLGVIAETFRRRPTARRSTHAFAFAAEGPGARRILEDSLPIPPHIPASPVGRVHELDGRILLLGVDHDANTTLHLAEALERVPYGTPHWITVERTVGEPADAGRSRERERVDYIENESCCELFRQAGEWLRAAGLERSGTVGYAAARLMRSRDLVAEARRRLRADPRRFLHPPGAGCRECDEARRHRVQWPDAW